MVPPDLATLWSDKTGSKNTQPPLTATQAPPLEDTGMALLLVTDDVGPLLAPEVLPLTPDIAPLVPADVPAPEVAPLVVPDVPPLAEDVAPLTPDVAPLVAVPLLATVPEDAADIPDSVPDVPPLLLDTPLVPDVAPEVPEPPPLELVEDDDDVDAPLEDDVLPAPPTHSPATQVPPGPMASTQKVSVSQATVVPAWMRLKQPVEPSSATTAAPRGNPGNPSLMPRA